MTCCPPRQTIRPALFQSRTGYPVRAPGAAPGLFDVADVPGGSAFVGTNRPEFPIDGESPLRKAPVKPFRIDRCAVTNARFAAFVADTGYITEAERFGDSLVFHTQLQAGGAPTRQIPALPWWHVVDGANWRLIAGPGSENLLFPDHPVVHVSCNDAMAFAEWAGGRLPTETEWEHAARGGGGDIRYPWGDRAPNDVDFFPCNIWQGDFPNKNTAADGYVATAPAQSFEPNGYGLYNMVGNVWEWTAQPFKVRSLSKAAAHAHAGKQGYKVTKGGSYLCHASYCHRYRIAARTGTSPDSTTTHQGFRVVYDQTQWHCQTKRA